MLYRWVMSAEDDNDFESNRFINESQSHGNIFLWPQKPFWSIVNTLL
jgi:hypothetical protein